MAQIGVYGSAKACALRVARLSSTCAPAPGSTNGVATSAIVRLAATANTEAGEVYQLKNGCGNIAVRSRESDKLTDMNIALDLATRDFELIELLTGASLIVNGTGQNIGIGRRGVGLGNPDFVSLEIWTQSLDEGGLCAVGGVNPGWFRAIYPRATFVLGDTTVENGIAAVSLTGYGTQNPSWGNGPFNDYPGVGTLPTTVAEAIVLDANGPPVLQNGYIAVPSDGTTLAAPSPAPTATAGVGAATANWTTVTGATGYRVQTFRASDNTVLFTDTVGAVLTFTRSGLTAGVPVYFKVATISAAGTGVNSAASNTVTPT